MANPPLGEHLDLARALVALQELGPEGTAMAAVKMAGALHILQLDLVVMSSAPMPARAEAGGVRA